MARRKKGMFGKSTGYAMPSQWDVKPDMPMGRPQTNYPMPSQWDVQPQEKKPGFFDKGGASQYVFAGIQDFLQRRMDEQPTGVANLLYRQQQEQQARAEAAAAQRKRAMDLADYDAKKQIDQRYATPEGPKTYEDNAGNRWAYDPATGQTIGDKPIWIDPTEKVIYQDGMQIRVPNPYRSAAPAPVSEDEWNNAQPMGGTVSNGGGPF